MLEYKPKASFLVLIKREFFTITIHILQLC